MRRRHSARKTLSRWNSWAMKVSTTMVLGSLQIAGINTADVQSADSGGPMHGQSNHACDSKKTPCRQTYLPELRHPLRWASNDSVLRRAFRAIISARIFLRIWRTLARYFARAAQSPGTLLANIVFILSSDVWAAERFKAHVPDSSRSRSLRWRPYAGQSMSRWVSSSRRGSRHQCQQHKHTREGSSPRPDRRAMLRPPVGSRLFAK